MVIPVLEHERINRRKAAIATAIICAILLFLMFILIAYSPPDPPPPGVGFELNFGTQSEGSGKVQPTEPVGQQQPQEKIQEELPQEVQEAVKEVSDAAPVQQDAISKLESPVKTEKEVKKDPPKEVKKEVKEVAKEPVKEQPKKEEVKPQAVYQPKGKTTGEGDDKEKVGDKGDPRGVDKAAMYTGEPGEGGAGGGGAGGASLQLDGWKWDYIPKPTLPKNETGHIKFKIVVDQNGYIVKCTPIDKALSPEAERIITQEIRKLTFSKMAGASVPEESTGTIEYKIRAK